MEGTLLSLLCQEAVQHGAGVSCAPFHTPPPRFWVAANSAIGGWGDKASCFSLSASSPRGQSLTLLKPSPHQATVFSPGWGLRSVSTDTEGGQLKKQEERKVESKQG